MGGFVTRMWEKIRPRDTVVAVSEHVGEIRKPVVDESGLPFDLGQQLTDRFTSVFTPLRQTGEAFWNAMQGDPSPAVRQRRLRNKDHKSRRGEPTERPHPMPHQSQRGLSTEIKDVGHKSVFSSASSSDAAPQPCTPVATIIPPVFADRPLLENGVDEIVVKKEGNFGGEEDADGVNDAEAEQISSTVLIEATLKLEDGSVQSLQVLAADRCKEVAQHFVQKHSLKICLQDPLTEWLNKVENDAVTFPVRVEADLMEIRKLFSKRS